MMNKQLPLIGRFLTIGVIGLAFLAPWLISAYELTLLGRFLALSILAIGLVLLWGEAGVLSLGQGVFFGLGGYALAMNLKLAALGPGEIPDFMSWSGRDALPWWWEPFGNSFFAVMGVILVPGIFAALFSWLVFRRRVGGVYFALITQALALCFATLLVSQQQSTGGFNGLTDFQTFFGLDLGSPGTIRGLYWATLLLLIASFAGVHWLLSSRFGKLLRATRDGENRVRFLGYDPAPYKVVAFTLSAVLAGVAGALFTLHAGVISPALVGVVPSIEMVIWVAIGGRKSLWGAIAGTLLVNFAKDQISSALPSLWLYALGLVFVLVVTLLPEGLAGLGSGWTSRLSRRRPITPVASNPVARVES
ncbi:Urea ABC transporter, permease protein UrtC [Methylocella tundrae]|uniref:Urea ABC transporter, permease protein UrtC n=2 Tax=Methylocella tundrae TaxID=227605 RepID=A0A8B6M3T5_METTU|nr:Urea ABC transporter, permease protein UrtC [Methylocella tundrae]